MSGKVSRRLRHVNADSRYRQTRSRGQAKSGRARSAAYKIGVEAQEYAQRTRGSEFFGVPECRAEFAKGSDGYLVREWGGGCRAQGRARKGEVMIKKLPW